MKKRNYINTAILIALTALILSSCDQNPPKNTLTTHTSTVSSQPSTNSETNPIDKLKSEGYSTEDIQSSESYLSRIILQLNEIETFSSINFQSSNIENSNSNDSADYSALLSKIDEQKAIYYMVKLNNNLNSLEESLNEYLFCLQSELDIELYFEDKEKYNDEKNEKMSSLNSDEFITVRDIEQKALENLQNINNSNNSNPTVPGAKNNDPNLNPNIINPQPNIPTVEVPKPIDPSTEISNKSRPPF